MLGRSFTPASLPGLAAWLRADSGVYSGNAAAFTAASTMFLSIADNASLSMGAGVSFTLAGWVWFNGLGTVQGVAGKSVTTVALLALLGEYVLYKDAADKINFYVSDGATAVTTPSTGTVTASAWHFVVGRRDGVNISVSVDNGAFANTASSVAAQDSTGAFVLGGVDAAGTTPLDGKMDAVGLWKRALSNAEVTQLYNGGTGLRYQQLDAGLRTTLTSWWDLEEPTGTRVDSVGANNLASNNSVGITDGIALSAAVDADAVRQWNGGSLTATQSTGTKRPLYKANILNGKPVLRFDGVDDALVTAAVVTNSVVFTIAGVFKITATGVAQVPVSNGVAGTNGYELLVDSTNARGVNIASVANCIDAAVTASAEVWVALRDTTVQLFINGTNASLTNASSTPLTPTGVTTLGTESAGTLPCTMDCLQLVIYGRALTASERVALTKYLGQQAGIAVT